MLLEKNSNNGGKYFSPTLSCDPEELQQRRKNTSIILLEKNSNNGDFNIDFIIFIYKLRFIIEANT